MRNFKKVIAVVVTLVMLLGIAAISASAAGETPVLSLHGKGETGLTEENGTELYELAVYLDEAGSAVGAVEGTITYDPAVFDYEAIESNLDVATNPEGSIVKVVTDENGTETGAIRFVAIASETGELFVLKFAVKQVADEAVFTLTTKAANEEGTDYLNVKATNDSVNVVEEDIINLEGVAMKKIDNPDAQDLKYNVAVVEDLLAEKYGEKEVVGMGVLLMFTQRLEKTYGYADLTVEMLEGEGTYGLAHAYVETDTAKNFEVNLNNMTPDALGIRVSARAYIKFSDDSVIYSKNFNSEYDTNSGYASKSVVDVAREAALDCEGADEVLVGEINEILAKSSIKGDDRIKLLEYINDYYAA